MVWRPITSHLLVVCQHPHLRMRQWGCEAITFLTRHALQFNHEPPLKENNRLQTLLLSPLAELSAIPFPDVRQKQLDTVLHILHSSGEFTFILTLILLIKIRKLSCNTSANDFWSFLQKQTTTKISLEPNKLKRLVVPRPSSTSMKHLIKKDAFVKLFETYFIYH